jgi:hypothetical protein
VDSPDRFFPLPTFLTFPALHRCIAAEYARQKHVLQSCRNKCNISCFTPDTSLSIENAGFVQLTNEARSLKVFYFDATMLLPQ